VKTPVESGNAQDTAGQAERSIHEMKNEYPKWHDEQFNRQKETHLFWYVKADELRRASELCWDQYQISFEEFRKRSNKKQPLTTELHTDIGLLDVSYFLLGLALENVIKGIFQKETGKYPDLIHKTIDLIEKTEFPLTEKDRDYLEILTKIVLWGGRYPLPKKKKDFELVPHENGGWKSPVKLSPDERAKILDLLIRLNEYQKKIEPAI